MWEVVGLCLRYCGPGHSVGVGGMKLKHVITYSDTKQILLNITV